MYSSKPNLVKDLCAGIARIKTQREQIDTVVKTIAGLITVSDMRSHASEGSVDLKLSSRDTGEWSISIVRPHKSNGQDFWISSINLRRNGVLIYEHGPSSGVKPTLPLVGIVHYQLKYLVVGAIELFPGLEDSLSPFSK